MCLCLRLVLWVCGIKEVLVNFMLCLWWVIVFVYITKVASSSETSAASVLVLFLVLMLIVLFLCDEFWINVF